MKNNILFRIGLSILFSVIILSNSFATDKEPIERNWRQSLDLYYWDKLKGKTKIQIECDDWFKKVFKSTITAENNDKIRLNLRTKTEGNIASVKYGIVYMIDGIKKYREYEPDVIFMSGISPFKTAEDYEKLIEKSKKQLQKQVQSEKITELEKEEKLKQLRKNIPIFLEKIEKYKKSVYLTSSFYKESKLPTDLQEKRDYMFTSNTQAFKNLLGFNNPEPIHAEALAVLYLFGGFDEKVKSNLNPDFVDEGAVGLLEDILEQESKVVSEDKPITIIDSILVVATLKDPCFSICMPMFASLKDNMGAILENLIKREKKRNLIKVHPEMESVILIGGVQPYINSRGSLSTSSLSFKNDILLWTVNNLHMIYSANFG